MATCPECGEVRNGFTLDRRLRVVKPSHTAGFQVKFDGEFFYLLEHSCGWKCEVYFGHDGYLYPVE